MICIPPNTDIILEKNRIAITKTTTRRDMIIFELMEREEVLYTGTLHFQLVCISF